VPVEKTILVELGESQPWPLSIFCFQGQWLARRALVSFLFFFAWVEYLFFLHCITKLNVVLKTLKFDKYVG
jgi:hypothetical protein